eukprot:COSAG03_NODE_720_length_6108_cov_5.664170_7_plen_64_part_00
MLLADPSASVGWARARVWLGEEPQVGPKDPKGGKLTDCTLSTVRLLGLLRKSEDGLHCVCGCD